MYVNIPECYDDVRHVHTVKPVISGHSWRMAYSFVVALPDGVPHTLNFYNIHKFLNSYPKEGAIFQNPIQVRLASQNFTYF